MLTHEPAPLPHLPTPEGEAIALRQFTRHHQGHLSALDDLAEDLASQARLPRNRVCLALAAYYVALSRQAMRGEPN